MNESAPVAQRIEHLTTDQKARGSNPFRRTLINLVRRFRVQIYLFSAWVAIVIHAVIQFIKYDKAVTPIGDPYTYQISFMNIYSQDSIKDVIEFIFEKNWYWTQNIFVYLFTPFQGIERGIFFFPNYFIWLCVTLIIYSILSKAGVNEYLNILLSLFPFLIRLNTGLKDFGSMSNFALDSLFNGFLTLYVFLLIFYQKKLKPRICFGLIVSIIGCLAVTSRGNAIATIFIFVAVIAFIYIRNFKLGQLIKYILILTPIPCVYSYYYFMKMGKGILSYYSDHALLIESKVSTLDWSDFIYLICSMPGFFFTHKTGFFTSLISVSIHIFIFLLGLKSSFRFLKFNKRNNLSTNNGDDYIFVGFISYFFILFSNCFLLSGLPTGPLRHLYMNLFDSTQSWRPILLSLLLVLVGGALQLKSNNINIPQIKLKVLTTFLALVAILNAYTEDVTYESGLRPEQILKIARQLKNIENKSSFPTCFLWYGNLNKPLFNYYLKRSGTSTLIDDSGFVDYPNLFNVIPGKDNLVAIKVGINRIFDNCGVIFVPKNFQTFENTYAYALARNRLFTSKLIESRIKSKFSIVNEICDHGDKEIQILVSQNLRNFQEVSNLNIVSRDMKCV